MSTSLDESGRLAGGHCWSERRMFESLGGWVAATEEPAVKLMLDRHSQHHAWRAVQWWERLPVLAGVERDALVRAPSPVALRATDLVGGCTGTVTRLAAAYRFALPRMFGAYEQHRAMASPVSDGSALRTLGLVGPDLASDWAEGEVSLQSLIRSDAAAQQAADIVARLEGVAAAG